MRRPGSYSCVCHYLTRDDESLVRIAGFFFFVFFLPLKLEHGLANQLKNEINDFFKTIPSRSKMF